MKEKIKEIFAILILPIIFLNHFPFLATQTKQKEEANVMNNRFDFKQENPELPHNSYLVSETSNWFIFGITTTASAVSSFVKDMFNWKK